MVRFIASRPALLELKDSAPGCVLASFDERRIRAERVVRAHCLRLRVAASDVKMLKGAMRALLPSKTYIPMGAVAGRLRSVSPSPSAAVPRRRFVKWQLVSIAAALMTSIAGMQAVSFFYA